MGEDLSLVLRAAHFASRKHAGQQRKGAGDEPYITHPLQVASLLAGEGGVGDPVVLAAGLLHDTLEDTETTPEELEEHFGRAVRLIVEEVTDDKSLPQDTRRRRQVEKAAAYSPGAKAVRIADKIANIGDVLDIPPPGWSAGMKRRYVDWAVLVVANCRGVNGPLEELFDRLAGHFAARS